MTLKLKKQKSKDKHYQVLYSVKDGKETYLGTEKILLRLKAQADTLKNLEKKDILQL